MPRRPPGSKPGTDTVDSVIISPATTCPAGFFKVRQQDGRWIFVDPNGKPFYSIGIDCIWPKDDEGPPGPKYDGLADNGGDVNRWAAQTLSRMDSWHANTIGAWSLLHGKAYVVDLDLARSVMDVFSPDFEDRVRSNAQGATRRADIRNDYGQMDRDPNLLGYFTDNELYWGWGYSWNEPGMPSIFGDYAAMPVENPNKQAWAAYMADAYHNDFKHLSAVWNVDVSNVDELSRVTAIEPRGPEHFAEADRMADGFLRRVADKYFTVTGKVMSELLPHHLNLGPRLTDWFPRPVVEVAGKYCDVLSLDMYNHDLKHFKDQVDVVHEASGKPVLIEYSFPAKENRSGNKNQGYEQAEVKDDAERGEYYARTAASISSLPYVVGAHWFQYFDEPTNGRDDGESCNFGTVDLQNHIYDDLANRATAANAALLENLPKT